MAPLTPMKKNAVLIAVVVAFAFPLLLLITGVLFMVAGLAVAVSVGELRSFLLDNVLARPFFVVMLLGGVIGMAGLLRLTAALVRGKPPRSASFIRVAAGAGIVCLIAAIVMLRAALAAQPLTWWVFAVLLPMAVAAWLVYLGRSFLWPGLGSARV